MATWKLSPQYKKSAVEKMFFYKDSKIIAVEQGFRWATFSVDSDTRPLTDEELKNEDGYELGSIDNDESWEMWDMTDGCWLEITGENSNTTSTDVEEFEAAWEEDGYNGVEDIGWSNDDTEYFYFGPLELTNANTGEVFKGEPDEQPEPTELVQAPLSEQDDEPVVTDWFPVSINPVRIGAYQTLSTEEEVKWPFASNVEAGVWDGKKWDKPVLKWRGLTKNPN